MKKTRQWLSKVVCLVVACALFLCITPMSVSAATPKSLLLVCAGFNSDAEVLSMTAGIPVTTGDAQLVISSSTLNKGDDLLYVVIYGEEGLTEIAIVQEMEGLAFCAIDEIAEKDCYAAGQVVVGENATMVVFNTDYDPEFYTLSIEGYDSSPTEDGLWELDVNVPIPDSQIMLPAAIINENNELIAVAANNNGAPVFYAFSEPTTGAATEKEDPEPVSPTRETIAPETEATEVPATTENSKPEPTKETTPPGPEPEPEPIPVVAIVAGIVAVLAIAFFVIKKQRPTTPSPVIQKNDHDVNFNIPDISNTQPVPETQPVRRDNENVHLGDDWESVPEDNSVTVYIAAISGALTGQEYPLRGQSILIGRAEEASIRFPADTKGVSRRHCKIMMHNGALMVMDLGSTSGTYLRGQGQLSPNSPVPVKEGDVIYLGSKQNAFTIRVK